MNGVISDIDATIFRLCAEQIDIVDESTGSTVVCWRNHETGEVMIESITMK